MAQEVEVRTARDKEDPDSIVISQNGNHVYTTVKAMLGAIDVFERDFEKEQSEKSVFLGGADEKDMDWRQLFKTVCYNPLVNLNNAIKIRDQDGNPCSNKQANLSDYILYVISPVSLDMEDIMNIESLLALCPAKLLLMDIPSWGEARYDPETCLITARLSARVVSAGGFYFNDFQDAANFLNGDYD